MKCDKMANEKNSAKISKLISQVKISNCWPDKQKYNTRRELLNAAYENSNRRLDDYMIESCEQNTESQSRGLENIPISDTDISKESNVEFSFSTPKRLNDLSSIVTKRSPENNVVSITENLVDSPDDDEDGSDEEAKSNHVVYINEDLVKLEEFVDENSEESFDNESNKNSKKDEELNCSFDENAVKKEFHITDTLRIKLDKLDFNEDFMNNYEWNSTSQSNTHSGTVCKKTTASSSKKFSKKSSFSNKSSKSRKTSRSNQRCKPSHSNVKSKRSISLEPKLRSKTSNQSNSRRQSLRLSGKSPEVKLPDHVSSLTRSGKKRTYEEPKTTSTNRSPIHTIDDAEILHLASETDAVEEAKTKDVSRSHSPSPSKYRKKIEVFFACQCCNEKYDSVEQVKVHIRTHFPNCATI